MNVLDIIYAVSKRLFRCVAVRKSIIKDLSDDQVLHISQPINWSVHTPMRYLAKSYLSDEKLLLEGVNYDEYGVAKGFKHWQLKNNPLPACSSSLHFINLKGQTSNELLFMRNANYLVSLIDTTCQLRYADIFLENEHLRNMPSCLSNGLACSVFVRAHMLTGNATFKDALSKVVKGLQISVQEGGVAKLGEFGPLLLEYPGSKNKSLVLNGWISALIGLLESRKLLRDCDDFISMSIRSFLLELPRFEYALGHRYARDWTRLSGGVYPVLLCFQLLHLGELLQSRILVDLSEDWTKYARWGFKDVELNIVRSRERYFSLLNEVRASMS